MNPVVSIIVPVYNAEKHLGECVESIINQSYNNLEIILIDDGSCDRSGIICDECSLKDSRIKVIHKENGGVSSARNTGIDYATGDWLYFMDSDDWLEPETFEVLIKKASETGADMLLFDYIRVYAKYKTFHRSIINRDKKDYYNNLDSLDVFKAFSQTTTVWSFMTKTRCIKNKVKFDTNLKNAEDRIFRLECYRNISSFAYIRQFFYNYRYNSSSVSNNRKDDIRLHEEIIFNKITEIFNGGNYPENCLAVRNRYFINNLNQVIVSALENKTIKFNDRKKYIFQYIESDCFVESLKNCNKEDFTGMVKILFKCRKITMFNVYFSYFIREVFRFLRKLKSIVYKTVNQ